MDLPNERVVVEEELNFIEVVLEKIHNFNITNFQEKNFYYGINTLDSEDGDVTINDIVRCDFVKFEKEKFILDLSKVDWKDYIIENDRVTRFEISSGWIRSHDFNSDITIKDSHNKEKNIKFYGNVQLFVTETKGIMEFNLYDSNLVFDAIRKWTPIPDKYANGKMTKACR